MSTGIALRLSGEIPVSIDSGFVIVKPRYVYAEYAFASLIFSHVNKFASCTFYLKSSANKILKLVLEILHQV